MSNLVLAIRARIYRDGLAATLSSRPGVAIVSAEADAVGMIAAVERYRPDAVLIDIEVGCAQEVVSLARQASASTRVVALGMRADNDDELLKWAEAGAVGFVTCDNSVDELLTCISSALEGELACSPRISATLLRRVAQLAAERAPSNKVQPCLTPRQTCILQLLRSGQSNKQIARELGIELTTVKNHVHHLLQRLQVHRRYEAAASVPLYSNRPHTPAP